MRLKKQGILYLIADRKLGDEKILEALAAGVDLVQLREKNVTSARYLEDALWLKEQAKRTGALFLDENCDLIHVPTQMVIHGHNMKEGAMFGMLKKYKDQQE